MNFLRLGYRSRNVAGAAGRAGRRRGLARPAPPARRRAAAPPLHLHIVGGLGSLKPFTQPRAAVLGDRARRLSSGRYTAEIVPFDRAGIRAQEALTLVQLGAVPFATVQVSGGIKDPELSAPDLSGLNPDMASMRRSVAAFRPYLEDDDAQALRHRGAGAVRLSGAGAVLQEAARRA